MPKGWPCYGAKNYTEKEWGALGAQALVPNDITYEPKINSRTVQGERTRVGAWQESGAAAGGRYKVGDSQEGSGPTVNGAAELSGSL